ncbi:macro domain-containing protein [Streptomyces sp. AK04-3B]|uniref:macro domain-containing protein n=1 Tax=Streptomyces sp. AK04-3B TaxID=3028650 RepID=UPI0029BFAE92|nr:macro domain-containing protein [Streptomyces sp. AK04-3B]
MSHSEHQGSLIGPVDSLDAHVREALRLLATDPAVPRLGLLASSYRACLDLAAEVAAVRTVAFCAVSTGVFGYPRSEAAPVALRTVADWLDARPGRFDRVVFAVFGEDDERACRHALGAAVRP